MTVQVEPSGLRAPTPPENADAVSGIGESGHRAGQVRPAHAPVGQGRGTAVVVGGGFAGILAARVLAEYTERVVVVERDRYPAGPEWRPGTPQSSHAHLLLEAGHRGLERLLPGIRGELLAAGAVSVEIGSDLRWLNAVGWMKPHDAGLTFLSVTRPLLDYMVRTRVFRDPKIEVVEGTKAVGLLSAGHTVTGVRIRERGHRATVEVPAELVVDASGRDSVTDKWLAELGFAPTPTVEVDAGCVYSSRLISLPTGVVSDRGFGALYLQTSPGSPWTGSLLPVESGQFIVSLGGMRGGQPGRGEAGFEALLHRQRDPILQEIVLQALEATDVSWLPAGPSMRRDVHREPDGLIKIGDARRKFNPVYGQGMSSAILAVLALGDGVARFGGINTAAQRAACRGAGVATAPAWLMSSSEDARLPQTLGAPRGPLIQAQHRFLDRVSLQATRIPRVSATFAGVMSMVDSPMALLRPGVLGPALLNVGGRGRR